MSVVKRIGLQVGEAANRAVKFTPADGVRNVLGDKAGNRAELGYNIYSRAGDLTTAVAAGTVAKQVAETGVEHLRTGAHALNNSGLFEKPTLNFIKGHQAHAALGIGGKFSRKRFRKKTVKRKRRPRRSRISK